MEKRIIADPLMLFVDVSVRAPVRISEVAVEPSNAPLPVIVPETVSASVELPTIAPLPRRVAELVSESDVVPVTAPFPRSVAEGANENEVEPAIVGWVIVADPLRTSVDEPTT
jgi:hypothetical protein